MPTSDTTKTVSISDIAEMVKILARERHDFIYHGKDRGECLQPFCFYTQLGDESEPGCIIGVAIKRLYPELWEEMRAREERGCNLYTVETLLCSLPSPWRLVDSETNMSALRLVQKRQDTGFSWGQCIPK